jgi:hypothetical protein
MTRHDMAASIKGSSWRAWAAGAALVWAVTLMGAPMRSTAGATAVSDSRLYRDVLTIAVTELEAGVPGPRPAVGTAELAAVSLPRVPVVALVMLQPPVVPLTMYKTTTCSPSLTCVPTVAPYPTCDSSNTCIGNNTCAFSCNAAANTCAGSNTSTCQSGPSCDGKSNTCIGAPTCIGKFTCDG